MPINIGLPASVELKPRIKVIGVGGAGGNAVNNMIESGLDGVEFIVANTDAQALALNKAERRVQMGQGITQGLGAGMQPEVGERSAEESLEEIIEHIEDAHMLFVAAGMGGGTGTGAAPVIARAARERGILTVAIVTKPFSFEGSKRMRLAEEGIEEIYSAVDTLIVIPNQNLFRIATEQTTMTAAFSMADEVLNSGVRSVTDLMMVPGMINLDFNDVRTVMDEMGKAMMGTGEATGDRRAVEAAEAAISNPLLDDVSLTGAKGVLINITGGNDLTLFEVDEAAELIRQQVDEDANIIVGSAQDPDLQGIVRVSVVATGVDAEVQPLKEARRDPIQRVVPITPVRQPVQQLQNQVEEAFEDAEVEVAEMDEAPEAESAPEPAPVAVPRPYPSPLVANRDPEPAPAQAPAAAVVQPVQPVAPQPAVAAAETKPRFGFFSRRNRSVPIAPPAPVAPRPAAPQRPAAQTTGHATGQATAQPTGDLFGNSHDEELEIPSFLRRSSR